VALAAWVLGDGLGGSGFLAAWVAGMILGRTLRGANPGIGEFIEDSSHLLTLLSFFVFGAFVLRALDGDVTWRIGLYGVLSLTVVRLVPVAISMVGLRLRGPSLLYLGWFGPRGLASIILVATVLDEAELSGASTIITTMAATVGLSVYAHGASAWWGSNLYANWYESYGDESAGFSESGEVPDVPVSRRLGHVDPPQS
jgi:NhaP-type Na+/H+ or K+/H+ antiporter